MESRPARTLVLGGARSGKSAHAERLLTDRPATYVATARRDPADPEWTERIAVHTARRPATWTTREPEPWELAHLLRRATPDDPPILVDDVATWLVTVLDDAGAWDGGSGLESVRSACATVTEAVATCPAPLVLVSAEVGLGIVPEHRSGRLFRDQLGELNADLAERCTDVLLLVAGIPLTLRSGGPT